MLTASSCGGVGDVTVTVLSSKRPGRGPYKCVGGHFGYPMALATSCSFWMTFRYDRDTTYYLAVGSADFAGKAPNVQLRLAPAEAPAEQPPGPAPLGTWPNPRVIPPGQAGLPYLSEQLTVRLSSFFFRSCHASGWAGGECCDWGRDGWVARADQTCSIFVACRSLAPPTRTLRRPTPFPPCSPTARTSTPRAPQTGRLCSGKLGWPALGLLDGCLLAH